MGAVFPGQGEKRMTLIQTMTLPELQTRLPGLMAMSLEKNLAVLSMVNRVGLERFIDIGMSILIEHENNAIAVLRAEPTQNLSLDNGDKTGV
jgi:hypothetical protein